MFKHAISVGLRRAYQTIKYRIYETLPVLSIDREHQRSHHPLKNLSAGMTFQLKEGLIFPYVQKTHVKEYVIRLAKVTNQVDIRYCLRISRNKINIFLKDKERVDYFLQHLAGTEIDKNFVKARRLANPDKRIIISYAPPFVPQQLINSFNVKLFSNITFLKLGMKDEQYSHIQSFHH